jgi:hypothetical protein
LSTLKTKVLAARGLKLLTTAGRNIKKIPTHIEQKIIAE